MTIAASNGSASPLANNIRKGAFAQMQQTIELQNNRLRLSSRGAVSLPFLFGESA